MRQSYRNGSSPVYSIFDCGALAEMGFPFLSAESAFDEWQLGSLCLFPQAVFVMLALLLTSVEVRFDSEIEPQVVLTFQLEVDGVGGLSV